MESLRNRTCIYTAIINGYDNLKAQPPQSIGCDYILFTDKPYKFPRESMWEIRQIRSGRQKKKNGEAMLSRYPKILSHMFFAAPPKDPVLRLWQSLCGLKHYEYTIWIDGSAQILTSNFAQEVISCLKEYQLAMFLHPERDCIYDEALILENDLRFKGKGHPFLQQVESYHKEGYPKHNGLMACGVIVRNTRTTQISKIEKHWWNEVNKWAHRDQLSLPYVLWKNNYGWDKIELNLWQNHLIRFSPHVEINR